MVRHNLLYFNQEYSKLEINEFRALFRSFKIMELINETVSLFKSQIKAKHLDL